MFNREEIQGALEALIDKKLTDSSVELVGVQYIQSGGSKIARIYIDRPEGVTLSDCEEVNRLVNNSLEAGEVEVLQFQSVQVEVSSPGIDRILLRKKDYEKFVGSSVQVQLREPRNNQKSYTGILQGIKDGVVELTVDNASVRIPWNIIKVGHIKQPKG
jgi:ribosome maturation factor RimP